MSISAVPNRSRLTSLSESDWSLTRPPKAPIIPSPMGRSMAAVAVLEMNAEIDAAMAPKAMITP
jgi:hypothetical protein